MKVSRLHGSTKKLRCPQMQAPVGVVNQLASNNQMWRKYTREMQEGNPSHAAQVNLATWDIERYGSAKQKELFRIEGFAKYSGVDWEQLKEF